jgi:hypothetical protein
MVAVELEAETVGINFYAIRNFEGGFKSDPGKGSVHEIVTFSTTLVGRTGNTLNPDRKPRARRKWSCLPDARWENFEFQISAIFRFQIWQMQAVGAWLSRR